MMMLAPAAVVAVMEMLRSHWCGKARKREGAGHDLRYNLHVPPFNGQSASEFAADQA